MSSRSFTGQNGAIGWTATSWISAGSPVITTRFDFTSNNAFGAVRFFNHLDEDVIWRLLDWENALWEREKATIPAHCA